MPEMNRMFASCSSSCGKSVRTPLAARKHGMNHGNGDLVPARLASMQNFPARSASGVIQMTRVSFTTVAVS